MEFFLIQLSSKTMTFKTKVVENTQKNSGKQLKIDVWECAQKRLKIGKEKIWVRFQTSTKMGKISLLPLADAGLLPRSHTSYKQTLCFDAGMWGAHCCKMELCGPSSVGQANSGGNGKIDFFAYFSALIFLAILLKWLWDFFWTLFTHVFIHAFL